jgi:hypothetical protein
VLRVVLCDRLVLTLKWAEEGDLILSHYQNVGTFLFRHFSHVAIGVSIK